MKLHIGSEIKRVIEQKGIEAAWLAQQISTSRRNLYDILNRQDISVQLLSDISKALDHDFFSLFKPEDKNELTHLKTTLMLKDEEISFLKRQNSVLMKVLDEKGISPGKDTKIDRLIKEMNSIIQNQHEILKKEKKDKKR